MERGAPGAVTKIRNDAWWDRLDRENLLWHELMERLSPNCSPFEQWRTDISWNPHRMIFFSAKEHAKQQRRTRRRKL